jgi:hypothetical protein
VVKTIARWKERRTKERQGSEIKKEEEQEETHNKHNEET